MSLGHELKAGAVADRVRYFVAAREVRVSARKLDFPHACACCLGTPTTTYEAVHVRRGASRAGDARRYSWPFQYCDACLKHATAATRRQTAAYAAGVLVAILAASLAGLVVHVAGAGFVAVFAGALVAGGSAGGAAAIVLRRALLGALAAQMSPTCACCGPAVRFAGFRATVQHFIFANDRFAAAFVAENERKLVQ